MSTGDYLKHNHSSTSLESLDHVVARNLPFLLVFIGFSATTYQGRTPEMSGGDYD